MYFILSALLFSSITLAGHEKENNFDAKILNNPVKESLAKFELEGLPADFVPGKVSYKIQNALHYHRDIHKKTILKEHDAKLVKVGSFYQLHVPVSELSPGNYYLFIKLKSAKDKSGKGEKEFHCKHKHSKQFKDYAMFVVDETLEVKDPGLAGEKTLAGIDSDNDGVRDDVQRWINESTTHSKKLNLAMKQEARYYQLMLSSVRPDNREESNRLMDLFLDKRGCLSSMSHTSEEFLNYANEMKSHMENTKARILAQIQASKHADGTAYTLLDDEESTCEFDLNSLPN